MSLDKIILGTVQFGMDYGINNNLGKPSQNVVNNILDAAYENGIRTLDCAESYGNSQIVIGNYHSISKNRFKLITKYCSKSKELPNNITKRIEFDILTLRVKNIYCYMFHSYVDFISNYPLFKKEIKNLKDKGLILKLGVSVYSNQELNNLLRYTDIDIVQIPFNLLDNYYQRHKIIKKAKSNGISVHTRSTFLQGLFFRKTDKIPQYLKPLLPYLETIDEYASFSNQDLNTISLCYVKSQKFIDNFLIGVDSLDHLKKNIKSYDNYLSTDLIEKINSIKVREVELLNPSNWT